MHIVLSDGHQEAVQLMSCDAEYLLIGVVEGRHAKAALYSLLAHEKRRRLAVVVVCVLRIVAVKRDAVELQILRTPRLVRECRRSQHIGYSYHKRASVQREVSVRYLDSHRFFCGLASLLPLLEVVFVEVAIDDKYASAELIHLVVDKTLRHTRRVCTSIAVKTHAVAVLILDVDSKLLAVGHIQRHLTLCVSIVGSVLAVYGHHYWHALVCSARSVGILRYRHHYVLHALLVVWFVLHVNVARRKHGGEADWGNGLRIAVLCEGYLIVVALCNAKCRCAVVVSNVCLRRLAVIDKHVNLDACGVNARHRRCDVYRHFFCYIAHIDALLGAVAVGNGENALFYLCVHSFRTYYSSRYLLRSRMCLLRRGRCFLRSQTRFLCSRIAVFLGAGKAVVSRVFCFYSGCFCRPACVFGFCSFVFLANACNFILLANTFLVFARSFRFCACILGFGTTILSLHSFCLRCLPCCLRSFSRCLLAYALGFGLLTNAFFTLACSFRFGTQTFRFGTLTLLCICLVGSRVCRTCRSVRIADSGVYVRRQFVEGGRSLPFRCYTGGFVRNTYIFGFSTLGLCHVTP